MAVWISCSSAGLHVTKITSARALDSNFQPVAPTDRFGPGDTFYISVRLEGYRPGLALRAKWSYEGQPIHETQLDTAHIGDLYAGFSLSSDAPWASGRYSIDIVLDSNVLATLSFRVKALP